MTLGNTGRRGLSASLAGLIIFMLVAAPAALADGVVPDYVVIRLKSGTDATSVANDFGSAVEDVVEGTGLICLTIPPGSDPVTFTQALAKDGRIATADTDTYLDLDDVVGRQFHFAFDAGPSAGTYVNQGAYSQVNLGQTGLLSTGTGVIVAVLDTGATYSHPDLAGHYLSGLNAIDTTRPPLDLPDGVTNAATGHGTMIAGIIARLAPDARILPVKVLNADGIGTGIDVARAIHFAVTSGAKVINMSFGSHVHSRILDSAIAEAKSADVVMVASAGNDGAFWPQYPAAYGTDVIAVGSVEADNTLSPYSNWGGNMDVVAPGTGIRSTYWDGGYASWSGTSFSAPFVTAQAALLRAANPQESAGAVGNAISSTARLLDAVNPLYKGQMGKGLIDIETSVMAFAK